MDVVLDRTSLALERIAGALERQVEINEQGLANSNEMLELTKQVHAKNAVLEKALTAQMQNANHDAIFGFRGKN